MACNHASVNCRCNVALDFSDKSKWSKLLEKSVAQEGMTLEEIGRAFGVSRMAICKQEKRILEKFRALLLEKNITDLL